MEDTEHNEEMGKRLFDQAIELWINPEIEKRKLKGDLEEEIHLTAVQVIMNFDTPNEVRFNSEVKAVLEGVPKREIKAGEEIQIDEALKKITNVKLTEKDANAGHFTMLLHNGFWHMHFDFRYNSSLCSDYRSAANEFLYSSEICLSKNNMRAFVDNLFSATELIAKATLLMHDQVVYKSKSHGVVHSRYNKHGNLGNVNSDFTKLLNKLASLRAAARYLQKEFSLSKKEATKMLNTAKDMNEDLLNRIPQIAITAK